MLEERFGSCEKSAFSAASIAILENDLRNSDLVATQSAE
jgi:hypothetical protein